MKTAGRPAAGITPEQVAECQTAGMSQAQTAQALGVSTSTIARFWDRKPTAGRPKRLTLEEFAVLRADGKTDKEIAEITGVSVPTVSRRRRELEGERPPGTPNAPGQGRKPKIPRA